MKKIKLNKKSLKDLIKIISFVNDLIFDGDLDDMPEPGELVFGVPLLGFDPDVLDDYLEDIILDIDDVNLPSGGMLISLRAYRGMVGLPTYRRVVVEGFGDSPARAILNSMAGVEDGKIEQLNDTSAQRISEIFPFDTTSYNEPRPEEDVGIFIQKEGDGWVLTGKDGYFFLDDYREEAIETFFRLKHSLNLDGFSRTAKVIARQEGFAELARTYKKVLARKDLKKLLDEALEQRQRATELYQEAERKMDRAKKWSKVAQGIGIAAQLTGIASSVVSHFESKKTQLENQKKLDGAISSVKNDIKAARKEFRESIKNLNVKINSIVNIDSSISSIFENAGINLSEFGDVNYGFENTRGPDEILQNFKLWFNFEKTN